MIHRTTDARSPGDSSDQKDSITTLLDCLREGVVALQDAQIEAEVRGYFERHPNYSRYSRDLIHIAAVASRFQSDKERAAAEQLAPRTTRMLPSLP